MTRRRAVSWLDVIVSALTWGLGAALGVAAGAYLTAVGGVGTPGVEALDRSELLTLPLLAGTLVFAVVVLVRVLGALLTRARSRHRDENDAQQHDETSDSVSG